MTVERWYIECKDYRTRPFNSYAQAVFQLESIDKGACPHPHTLVSSTKPLHVGAKPWDGPQDESEETTPTSQKESTPQ